MLYYRYEIVSDNIYKLTGEKSQEPLSGERVVFLDEDIDLQLFDVIVGYISSDGNMLRHTKKIKSVEAISRKMLEIIRQQVELEIEADYRLSLIELGLI